MGGSLLVLGLAAGVVTGGDWSGKDAPRTSKVFAAPQAQEGIPGAVSSPVPLVASVLRETLESLVRGDLGPLDDPLLEVRVEGALEFRGWGDAAARSRAALLLVEELRATSGQGRRPSRALSSVQLRAISVVAARLAKRLVNNAGGGEPTPGNTEDLKVSVPAGYSRLDWKPLGQFEYRQGSELPPDVLRHDRQKVALVGYMLPVEQTRGAARFLLVESLWGCCFGSVPEMNQVVDVQVSASEGVDYRQEPVLVTGDMEVGEKREDEVVVSVYRLRNAQVETLK